MLLILSDEIGSRYCQHLTNGEMTREELIEMSFKFFAEGTKESIPSRFNLRIINNYFPECENEISLILRRKVMAKARATVFKNLDALVGKKFGPGLPNLLKQFVCMVVRMDSINEAIESIHNNLDRIKEEKDKGEDRKHIILKS